MWINLFIKCKIFVDSGLTKEGRNRHANKKYWNEGWIEEVENKINSREIEISNYDRKVEMKTKNKMTMDFSVEHFKAINVNMVELQKINELRKYKRVMLPYKLFGSSRLTLASYGRDLNEFSSVKHTHS